MSITVDDFFRLKKNCEPRSSLNLQAPLTDELIAEAVGSLRDHYGDYPVSRLEAAINVPKEAWPTLVLPRRDGLGNITPNGVAQAVRHAYWRLERTVERVAREKVVSEPAPLRLAEDGTVRCPWCGKLLALSEGVLAKAEGQND